MSRKAIALVVAFLVLVASDALADDARPVVQHVAAPFKVTLASGRVVDMPPSYIAPDPAWVALDVEMKRLQTAETRLAAENASLRQSAQASGGWGVVALLAGAFAAGVAARSLF